MSLTLAAIAQLVNGHLTGEGGAVVNACAGIGEAKEGELAFMADAKYLPQAQNSKASAILVPRQTTLPGKSFIQVDDPSFAFTQVLNHFLKSLPSPHPKGIHASAVIAKGAQLGKDVAVGALTIIDDGAVIGDGTVIYGQVYIGRNVKVGANCLLYPQVSIREDVSIGDRCILHNGAVLGSDGYGYATVKGQHVKIPQIGTVIVEDDVEIGANTCIDRARFDKTVIGAGTKIDNLVHIAHNVIVGKNCLIVAQAGVSGSTRLGNYVILAGQVGIVGHLNIGDGAIVAAQSGVSHDLKAGAQVFGSPAQPIKEAFRTNAHVQRLDHYVSIIKELKARVDALEKKDK